MWGLQMAGPAPSPCGMEAGARGQRQASSGEMQLSSAPLHALQHQLYKRRAVRDPRFSNDYFIANAMKSN